MRRHLILPNQEDAFLKNHKQYFTKPAYAKKLAGQKAHSKEISERIIKNDQRERFLNALIEAKVSMKPMEEIGYDEENVKELKQMDEEKFENYLCSLLDVLSEAKDPVIVGVMPRQTSTSASAQSVDLDKHVSMKPKDFFTQSVSICTSAFETVEKTFEHNDNIAQPSKSFLCECLRYVKYLSQETLLFLKPVDFLFAFNDNNNLTRLTVVLYCVYDLVHATGTALNLRKVQVRHIQEKFIPKERKAKVKRPRYLAIVYNAELSFTSNVVCEFLLQMIESGALRCSSLTKAFLLTKDTVAFYKYCLISKKVCLKRIVEPRSVRI